MLNWLINHLLLILLFLAVFTVFSYSTRGERPLHNILAWLLFAFLVPYIAIPLFLLVGQRKLRWMPQKTMTMETRPCTQNNSGRHSMENLLSTYGVPPATHNNQVNLLSDGVVAYEKIMQLFQNAKESILISTYRITDDEVGNKIIELLTQKARAGIRIYLLIDTVGGFMMFPRRKLKLLKQAGGSVRYIMPLFHTPFKGHANLRDHRKIIIIDGHSAIIGSINLATEYLGPTPYKKRWCDISMLIEGGAVNALLSIFESDWQFAAAYKESKTYTRPTVSSEKYGNAVLQIVASGPDLVGDNLYDAILSEIYNAKKSIHIVTPYFVLDESLQKALLLAIRRGVEVNIILPKHSNHPLTDWVRAIDVRKLHEEGAKIWLYTPTMLHAKVILFDNTVAILGSANFDLRSLLLNFEVSCFIYSDPEIQEISNWSQSVLTNCILYKPSASQMKIMLEYMMQILKPLS
jgi:cardiolipin synthase A/B